MPISRSHQPLKYSDYISPLPADELIKFAAKRQELYDEGVNKIEKRIDELDQYGFSLMKDEDKQYFSQEMDKFIKSVNQSSAKADFSNMANVRSILSIGRPLETDPLILNAIQSSAEIKRRQAELAKMGTKERSAANDYDYFKEAYEYLSDGQVGSKIKNSGKAYTPYKDLSEKFLKVYDKIKPKVESTPSFTPDGRYIITTKAEGVDAARLREAFEAVLDESDKNQLRIDVNYDIHARGRDNVMQEYKNQNLMDAAEVSKAIELTKADIDKTERILAGSIDPATQQTLANKKSILQELELRHKVYSKNATKPFDQVTDSDLVDFHKNTFINNLANPYAYQNVERDIKDDPYAMLAVKHSYDVAMENLRVTNDIEKEERAEIRARFKDKDLVTSGAGFMSLFNPDPSQENYLEKISRPDGWKYIYEGEYKTVNENRVREWQNLYNKYNQATNALTKLEALEAMANTVPYNSRAIMGIPDDKTLTDKELTDVSYDSNKDKNYGLSIVRDLIKTYKAIDAKKTDPNASIKITYPNNRVDEVKPADFMQLNLSDVLQMAKRVDLYTTNPDTGKEQKEAMQALKDYNELLNKTGGEFKRSAGNDKYLNELLKKSNFLIQRK
jgi:hypothetical protein